MTEEWKSRQILIFGGYMLRKCQGENLRSDSTLHIRTLPHDLVTGGIPHAGSWQFSRKGSEWPSLKSLQITNIGENVEKKALSAGSQREGFHL